MKVCTDACLFGAWFSTNYQLSTTNHVLDIGTGTGLLSLMFAQKNPGAIIDAVEIDPAAATQAAANFQQSPWGNRLNLLHTSIQQFYSSHPYNLIISNPPFFENDLKSPNAKRNSALHSAALTLEELLSSIHRLLAADGTFAILLPFHRTGHFINLAAQKNYQPQQQVFIKQTLNHPFFRTILLFSNHQTPANTSTLIIKNEINQYTPAFTTLLKDYYLHL